MKRQGLNQKAIKVGSAEVREEGEEPRWGPWQEQRPGGRRIKTVFGTIGANLHKGRLCVDP